MFTEYLINIAITAGAYLPLVVFVVIVALLMKPVAAMVAELNDDPSLVDKVTKHRGKVFKAAGVFALLIIVFAAMQPSNTYKHTGYDREADDRKFREVIERQRSQTVPVIQDRTRQPDLTREERQDRFESLVDRSRFNKDGEPQ